MQINDERLAEIFTKLCQIDSPSTKEKPVADYLIKIFSDLGGDVSEDDSASKTGSDCGNLLVRFPGNVLELEPVFFNCHMDTVQPGIGVKVLRKGNIFTSAGDTILGADDKSGIAVFIEVMQLMKENNIAYGPVEFLFTTCEEVGLRGAKSFDFNRLQSKIGYALDSTGTDKVIIGAPAANRLSIEIDGVSAHAGLNPELGISAIQIASKAISELHLGRLDHESTANIGLISGGTATNIIPDKVIVHGEVRSHSQDKLCSFTESIEETFNQVVDDFTDLSSETNGKPTVKFSVAEEYPVMSVSLDDNVIKRIESAAFLLDRQLDYISAGGGSDANIFNSHGLATAIIGTGMAKVHSTEETIDLQDMVRTAELVLAIITGSK